MNPRNSGASSALFFCLIPRPRTPALASLCLKQISSILLHL